MWRRCTAKLASAFPGRANRALSIVSHMMTYAERSHVDSRRERIRRCVRRHWIRTRGIDRNHEEPRQRYLVQPRSRVSPRARSASRTDQRGAGAVPADDRRAIRRSRGGRPGRNSIWSAAPGPSPSSHTKQRRTHTVPLSAPALALLADLREESTNECVFPGPTGRPIGQRSRLFGAALTKQADSKACNPRSAAQLRECAGQQRREPAPDRLAARPHPGGDHGPLQSPVRRCPARGSRAGRGRRSLLNRAPKWSRSASRGQFATGAARVCSLKTGLLPPAAAPDFSSWRRVRETRYPPWERLDEALDRIGHDGRAANPFLLAGDVGSRRRLKDGQVERLRPEQWRAPADWTNSRLAIQGPQLLIFGPDTHVPGPNPVDWHPVEIDLGEVLANLPPRELTRKSPSNSTNARSDATAVGRRGPPDGLVNWYISEHIPAGYSTRDEDLRAARKRFGSWTKDRDTLRALRNQHAPNGWKDPGPPKIRRK